ncbi:class I SAM-dependent methyltransferase [Leifsonia poae]|uniref:class I SAM-dependent methyltransferase n=1 Tax=Leifsonia poae TaxID=110933 RepID=UPI001CBE3C70|nr:class I SAM-dependent methyltransferase [Leifsonia poae]
METADEMNMNGATLPNDTTSPSDADTRPTPEFGKEFWEHHWAQGRSSSPAAGAAAASLPHPYLARETVALTPGDALDAGCGTGAEALWLAEAGWRVTAADISPTALAQAAARTASMPAAGRVSWVEADLTVWEPGRRFGLVVTSYAHPAMPALAFFARIARWVDLGGTLLIVAHRQEGAAHGVSPAGATVTRAEIIAVLEPLRWRIEAAVEETRTLPGHAGGAHHLDDVVVRATRLG